MPWVSKKLHSETCIKKKKNVLEKLFGMHKSGWNAAKMLRFGWQMATCEQDLILSEAECIHARWILGEKGKATNYPMQKRELLRGSIAFVWTSRKCSVLTRYLNRSIWLLFYCSQNGRFISTSHIPATHRPLFEMGLERETCCRGAVTPQRPPGDRQQQETRTHKKKKKVWNGIFSVSCARSVSVGCWQSGAVHVKI